MNRILLIIAVAGLLTNRAAAQDKSVNPGINKSFENVNVSEYVGRFEKEGRDAFDHRHEIIAAIGLKPGMAVADIGAGTGLFTRMFSSIVGPEGKVYAVDISSNFIDHIVKWSQQQPVKNIVGVVCTPESTALPPASVDLVYICDTYHHFEFPQKTLESIHKALKPKGQLILVDYHKIPGRTSEFMMTHLRAGQEVFVAEITAAGFQQIEEKQDLLKESYFVRFERK